VRSAGKPEGEKRAAGEVNTSGETESGDPEDTKRYTLSEGADPGWLVQSMREEKGHVRERELLNGSNERERC